MLEATASLNRRQQQQTYDKDTNDFHHPHYTHHRTYSSKAKEHSVSSSSGIPSSNLPYHYGSPYTQSKEMNDQIERTDREFTSTTMQNVIMSTSSRDNTRVRKDVNLPSHSVTGNNPLEAGSSMQQIASKQPGIIASDSKSSASSNRDHKVRNNTSDENAKSSSSSVVKRTKNMIISSQTERNSKPPTHETYHIEEML